MLADPVKLIHESNGIKFTLSSISPQADLRKAEHEFSRDQVPCRQHPARIGVSSSTKILSPVLNNCIIPWQFCSPPTGGDKPSPTGGDKHSPDDGCAWGMFTVI